MFVVSKAESSGLGEEVLSEKEGLQEIFEVGEGCSHSDGIG